MKWNSRSRCAVVCVGFTALFGLFSFRLIYLQFVRHTDPTPPRDRIFSVRGAIVDANGEVLAHNVPNESVIVDGTLIKDPDTLAHLLATRLGLDLGVVRDRLATKRPHIPLRKQVPLEVTAALRKELEAIKQRNCVIFDPSSSRVYPNGTMLCHVVGFPNSDGVGIQGIEGSMEQYLHNQDGYRDVERDRKGHELAAYRGEERAARDGSQVQLTIDLNLQNIVENEIDDAMRKYTPQKATIILMNPYTGEIMAMANRPAFDLNKRNEKIDPERMKNRAIADQIEPGSTFKIVTAAAALNESKVQPDTIINCENGSFNYGNRILHDHGSGYGELTVQDILIHSSNIGAAKLALSLGEQRFYEYIKRFGFGEPTGVELPGEIRGIIRPPYDWSKISITRIPMGHEVGVTPLQMTVAMAVIANGGNLVTPRIIKSITDADGKVHEPASFTPLRRVISEETAKEVGDALRGVVSDRGTAAGAAVYGFTVAGKTGTAQRLRPEGGYDPERTVTSFSGYMPAEHPAFVCFVVLDDPHTATHEENFGGKVAGPIFSHIAEKVARYMNLEPHEEIKRAIAVGEKASTKSARR